MDKGKLIDEFFENTNIMKRVSQNHLSAFLAEHQLSRGQMELLSTIHDAKIISPKDLAEQLKLTPGAISQLVDGLVIQGLLLRKTSPADRRSQLVSLTRAGQSKIRAITKKRNLIMKNILNDMTAAELRALLSMQAKLMKQFTGPDKK